MTLTSELHAATRARCVTEKRWVIIKVPRFDTKQRLQEVRGVTVSLAGQRVPPYTVIGWPLAQVLVFPLE